MSKRSFYSQIFKAVKFTNSALMIIVYGLPLAEFAVFGGMA